MVFLESFHLIYKSFLHLMTISKYISDMENYSPVSKSRRPQSASIPRSPRLSRSSSGASTASCETRGPSPHRSTSRSSSISLPEIHALPSTTSPQQSINRASRSATTSPRPSMHRSRSRSIIKSKNPTNEEREDENCNIPLYNVLSSPRRRLSLDSKVDDNNNNNVNRNSMARLLRSSSQNTSAKGVDKLLTRSPSAWALSPGRPLAVPPLASESPKVKGMSGVLKYFNKQKKISPEQEEEFHQYKILHNRLFQWRFANAKAEAAMSISKRKVEGFPTSYIFPSSSKRLRKLIVNVEKVFGVWLNLYKMRYAIAEKRMKVERLKQKVKFLEIVCPQIELLSEWEKLEKKNVEAVGRVARKLSAYSTKLPLVDGAVADTISVYEAMKLCLEVMENIEDTITELHLQAEHVSNMLSELTHVAKQNMECFQGLEKEIASILSLEAHEKSLIVHLIQANKAPEEEQRNCKHHLMRSFKNMDLRLIFSMLNVS